MESLFTRAKGTELMAESIEDLVLLYEARAGVHRREVESLSTFYLYFPLE